MGGGRNSVLSHKVRGSAFRLAAKIKFNPPLKAFTPSCQGSKAPLLLLLLLLLLLFTWLRASSSGKTLE